MIFWFDGPFDVDGSARGHGIGNVKRRELFCNTWAGQVVADVIHGIDPWFQYITERSSLLLFISQ